MSRCWAFGLQGLSDPLAALTNSRLRMLTVPKVTTATTRVRDVERTIQGLEQYLTSGVIKTPADWHSAATIAGNALYAASGTFGDDGPRKLRHAVKLLLDLAPRVGVSAGEVETAGIGWVLEDPKA